MSLFPDGVLNDLRNMTNSALPSRSTNSRLNLTRDVRISASTKSYRVPGLPYFMHTPAWKLRFQDGDGVLAGDTETAPTKGTYVVSEVLNPTDFSVSTLVIASRIKDAAGNPIPIFTPNYTVAIKSSETGQTVTIPVFITPADHDVQLYNLDPAYKWAVWFDPRNLYTDGSSIQANHTIYCKQFGTMADGVTPRPVPLSSPRVQTGVLPIACAYVKERPNAG